MRTLKEPKAINRAVILRTHISVIMSYRACLKPLQAVHASGTLRWQFSPAFAPMIRLERECFWRVASKRLA